MCVSEHARRYKYKFLVVFPEKNCIYNYYNNLNIPKITEFAIRKSNTVEN